MLTNYQLRLPTPPSSLPKNTNPKEEIEHSDGLSSSSHFVPSFVAVLASFGATRED